MGDAALTDGAVTVTLRLRGDSGVTSGSLELHYDSTLVYQDAPGNPNTGRRPYGNPGCGVLCMDQPRAEEDPMRLTLTLPVQKTEPIPLT